MTAKIIKLNGLDEQDEDYSNFLESLREDNVNAVYLLEKSDGSVTVGCNFENRKDLVFALFQLKSVIQSIVEDGE